MLDIRKLVNRRYKHMAGEILTDNEVSFISDEGKLDIFILEAP